MNVVLTLFDGDATSQVRGEGIHLAFLALTGGISLLSAVISFLLRRDLKRNDDDKLKLSATDKYLDEKIEANDRRHGYEISDIKIAVAPLFRENGWEPPDYPSR